MSLLFPSLSPSAALANDGKFLLAARRSHRPAGTEYLISLDAKNTSKSTYMIGFKGFVYTHDRFSPSFSWGVCTHGPYAHIIVLLLSFEILTYCFCIFNLSSLSSMPV